MPVIPIARRRKRLKLSKRRAKERKLDDKRNFISSRIPIGKCSRIKPRPNKRSREPEIEREVKECQKYPGGSIYKIDKIEVDGQKVEQPDCAENGPLPEHPFRSYIVGGTGSGKTNYVLNLLTKYYKDYFDDIIVISATAKRVDPSYKVLQLDDHQFMPCDERVVARIMELMEEDVEKNGKSQARKILVILDDFIHTKSFLKCKPLFKLLMQGRHFNISMFLLSQAYHRVPKSLRLNMSNVVYFKGSNKELEVLAEDYGAPGYSKKEVMNTISKVTSKRYNFFFCDINRPIGEGRYRANLGEELFTEVFCGSQFQNTKKVKVDGSSFQTKDIQTQEVDSRREHAERGARHR